MALKSALAYDAIEALLTGVTGLPAAIARDDKTLERFGASSADKVKHRLVMFTEAPRVIAVEMGDPPAYELEVPCTVVYMVEGEPGAARDGVWQAGLEALANALFPGGKGYTLANVIEDTRIESLDSDHYRAADNVTPVEAMEVSLALIVTAPTPFG